MLKRCRRGVENSSSRMAFTLVELLVVIAIIGVLIAVLLPAVQAARESGRRAQCQNQLRQEALSMITYNDAKRTLPQGLSDCCWGTWQVAVLPFLEETALHDLYVNLGGTGSSGAQYKDEPNLSNITSKRLSVATCPSDFAFSYAFGGSGLTKHNYAANFGATGLENSTQGVSYSFKPELNGVLFQGAPFANRKGVRLRDILDGLSKTLLLAEVVQGENGNGGGDTRGLTWWGDAAGFFTHWGPNATNPDVIYILAECQSNYNLNPPCVSSSTALPSMYLARSRHPGGVNAALCDGSVRFVVDEVERNLWHAYSSTRGAEVHAGEL